MLTENLELETVIQKLRKFDVSHNTLAIILVSFLAFPCVGFSAVIDSSSTNTEYSSGNHADLQGLEWLSLDVTYGISRAQIEEGFIGNDGLEYSFSNAASTESGAWRYATSDEVNTLLGSLTPSAPGYVLVENYEGANWIHNNFGYAAVGQDPWVEKTSRGMYGAGQIPGTLSSGEEVTRSKMFTATSGYISPSQTIGNSIQPYFPSGDVAAFRADLTQVNSRPSSDVGSYLVRTSVVPIPAAAWLFGSGLLALLALGRRRSG